MSESMPPQYSTRPIRPLPTQLLRRTPTATSTPGLLTALIITPFIRSLTSTHALPRLRVLQTTIPIRTATAMLQATPPRAPSVPSARRSLITEPPTTASYPTRPMLTDSLRLRTMSSSPPSTTLSPSLKMQQNSSPVIKHSAQAMQRPVMPRG